MDFVVFSSERKLGAGQTGYCYTYDALGRMVEKSQGTTRWQFLYSPVGKTAEVQNLTTTLYAYIPTPGGGTVYTTGTTGGNQFYQHKDWLGTARVESQINNSTVTYDRAFAPYGEMYDNFGVATQLNFTGDTQDDNSDYGLFDTPNRELAPTQGRWLSPDPAGDSWNAYAYGTDPNTQTDPTGLFLVPRPMLQSMMLGPSISTTEIALQMTWYSWELNWVLEANTTSESGGGQPGPPGGAAAQNERGFWCGLWQRISNLAKGYGFTTDQALEEELHTDANWLRVRGIKTEGMTEKQIIQTYDALQNAIRSGRHSVSVADKLFILGMIGAGGVQVTSKTLWNEGGARIDVENPNPGQRPGQIHYQNSDGKYLYNFEKGEFEGLSTTQNRNLLSDPDVQQAIQRGYRYLGIGQPEVLE